MAEKTVELRLAEALEEIKENLERLVEVQKSAIVFQCSFTMLGHDSSVVKREVDAITAALDTI